MRLERRTKDAFGETPNAAGETPALPKTKLRGAVSFYKASLVLAPLLWVGCASPSNTGTTPAVATVPAVSTAAGAVTSVPIAAASSPAAGMGWSQDGTPLFNGRDLTGWAVTDFVGHGAITVQSNEVRMATGAIMTGINWTNGALPQSDYEISLDAVKSDGDDFFCGLTFPVGDSFCSLILGGWGGSVVGLSSLDDMDASENETSQHMFFEIGRWYHVQIRVTAANIQARIDGEKVIDVKIAGRKVSLRPGPIEFSKPLGIATYQTGAAVRDVKLRLIKP